MVRAGHKRKSAAVDYKAYQSEQQVARYATPMTRPTHPKHRDKPHRYRPHGGDRVTSNVFYCHGRVTDRDSLLHSFNDLAKRFRDELSIECGPEILALLTAHLIQHNEDCLGLNVRLDSMPHRVGLFLALVLDQAIVLDHPSLNSYAVCLQAPREYRDELVKLPVRLFRDYSSSGSLYSALALYHTHFHQFVPQVLAPRVWVEFLKNLYAEFVVRARTSARCPSFRAKPILIM